MKKMILRILLGVLILVLLLVAGFGVLYAGRIRTVNSIEKVTDYDDYNLYRMDVKYDYSIDDVINYGITDNQSMIDAILKEALPLLPSWAATMTSSGTPRPCWSTARRRTATNPWR